MLGCYVRLNAVELTGILFSGCVGMERGMEVCEKGTCVFRSLPNNFICVLESFAQ